MYVKHWEKKRGLDTRVSVPIKAALRLTLVNLRNHKRTKEQSTPATITDTLRVVKEYPNSLQKPAPQSRWEINAFPQVLIMDP
jgi:hypothetical protein